MQRLSLRSGVYFCDRKPFAASAADAPAVVAGADAPELIYWDLEVGGDGRTQFGPSGLDAVLAAQFDLRDCAAVSEAALNRLSRIGAIASDRDLAGAIRILARSPAANTAYWPQAVSRAARPPSPLSATPEQPTGVDALSVIVISDRENDRIEECLDALGAQEAAPNLEILTLIAGDTSATVKGKTKRIDDWAAAHRSVRVRRFLLWGEFPRVYLVNTGMALASGEVAVVLDAACRPVSPDAVQSLANWAGGADVASTTPRLAHGDRLLAAGLGVDFAAGGGLITPVRSLAFSNGMRLCAAPAPWVFATHRRRWIAAGGAPASDAELWSGILAGPEGPRGRHLYIGSASFTWVGDLPGDEPARTPGRLRSSARRAIGAAAKPAAEGAVLGSPPQPLTASLAQIVRSRTSQEVVADFADPETEDRHALRLLVFADALGASQMIPFVEGLRGRRGRGEAVVTIVSEAAFADQVDLPAQVERLLKTRRPNLVVASRLGDHALWGALKTAVRTRRTPLLFHIDDDLLSAPVSLGIERYRKARQPRRMHTLHEALRECDLTLASTERLGALLARMSDEARVAVMGHGAAGDAPALRPLRRSPRPSIVYMGAASHNADLAMIAPAVTRVLETRPDVDFTLFGSIGKQPARRLLPDRVKVEPGVFGDYRAFKTKLAGFGFDIGLAPLAQSEFNRMKTPVKWLEYADAGIAVVASDIEPYRPMAREGALLAVGDHDWEAALRALIDDRAEQERLAGNADRMIRATYSWAGLEERLWAILQSVRPAEAAVAA